LQPEGVTSADENLGEHLQGSLIQSSMYKLQMNINTSCNVLCAPIALTPEVQAQFQERVREDYYVHWIVDNLPAAARDFFQAAEYRVLGFPLGTMDEDDESVALFNHAKITISVHQGTDPEGYRIVGFEVVPLSVEQKLGPDSNNDGLPELLDCSPKNEYSHKTESAGAMYVSGGKVRAVSKLTFSYDVAWVPSDQEWATRWDVYLNMGSGAAEEGGHWFAIVNATIIAVFLTGMTAYIMWRAVHRDITRYNRVATEEERAEDREESGWKLVHADVFRPPTTSPMGFAVLTGVGAQVSCMAVVTIVFSALGFLNPARRGSLVIGVLVLFCLLGFVAGYASARNHKLFDGKQWQRTTVLAAFAFPAFVAFVFLTLNTLAWAAASTNAVPFSTMVGVLFIWLLVSVPLTFAGAYFGFKAPKIEVPTKTSDYPRVVPAQPWFLQPAFTMLVGGILPFGAVFMEIFFIFSSIWLDRYYYVFGFLLLVAILLVITCSEIAIVLVYFQLCAEDWRWWWRSWLIPGSSAIYLALYAVYYFATQLSIMGATSVVLYFGYSLLLVVTFFLITGCIGYLATFAFIWRIYDAVKVA
jgi:transmembrane 9 superfamily protein 2/4